MRPILLPVALAGLLLVLLVLVGAGCDDEPEDKALRAAEIAQEIRENPEETEAVLEDHDMTIEQFEALIYEVAADPELSERYEEALAEE